MKELNFEQMAQIEGGGDNPSCAGAVATTLVVFILSALGGSVFGAVAAIIAGGSLIEQHCSSPNGGE